jgi:hypothetical protein
MRLRLASHIRTAEPARLFLYHGVKNPDDVPNILIGGFDLTRMESKWITGYGVSCFTKPDAVKKHFGNPGISIVQLTFDGNLAAPWDAEEAVKPSAPVARKDQIPWSPQDYNLALIGAGIDAIFLNTAYKSILEVIVYNLECIHRIEQVQ